MRGSHGKFYWNELMARDVDGARKFYADTMGWSYDAMPTPDGGTYWVAKMGEEPVGGIFDQRLRVRRRCRRLDALHRGR